MKTYIMLTFFSIIINMLRVHALSEIDKANKSGETFV